VTWKSVWEDSVSVRVESCEIVFLNLGAFPIHLFLFRQFCCRMYRLTTMHNITDRRTDEHTDSMWQTDRQTTIMPMAGDGLLRTQHHSVQYVIGYKPGIRVAVYCGDIRSLCDVAFLVVHVPWFSAIAVFLHHGRENQRTVCNFSIWTVTVMWLRNRTMPLQNSIGLHIEIYNSIAQFSLR